MRTWREVKNFASQKFHLTPGSDPVQRKNAESCRSRLR